MSLDCSYPITRLNGNEKLLLTKIGFTSGDRMTLLSPLEVFEHVLPRVARAFDNSSGCIAKTQGNYVLTNVTREGSVQIFDHLVFHCERETALETRVFAECDLLKHLAAAGLSEIEVHRNLFFEHGDLVRGGLFISDFKKKADESLLKNLSGASG